MAAQCFSLQLYTSPYQQKTFFLDYFFLATRIIGWPGWTVYCLVFTGLMVFEQFLVDLIYITYIFFQVPQDDPFYLISFCKLI